MAISITTSTQNVTYEDGHGRKTVVKSSAGQHFLISEVHRALTIGHRIDETLVFPCTPAGDVTDWSEVFSGDSTEDVLVSFRG